MTHTDTALSHYLVAHGLLDNSLVDTPQKDIIDALVQSGVMTMSQINQLRATLSGLPQYEKDISSVPSEVQSLVPYDFSRKNRVVCVEHENDQVCVVTDSNSTDLSLIGGLENKRVTTYHASSELIDNLLHQYKTNTHEKLISSITNLQKRIRVEKDFGSDMMIQFFPTDHVRDIAEDVSVSKMWKRIVLLGQVMYASVISVQSRSDKTVIRMRIGNTMQDVVTLRQSIAPALYCAMRYYCDLPLKANDTLEQGYTNTLTIDQTITLPVFFTPTSLGFTIDIAMNGVDELYTRMQSLGLSESDKNVLADFLRTSTGMCVISGKEKSGKSFAYYQILEACASRFRVASIEKDAEYVVDKINQLSWGKRPEKDLTTLVSYNDIIAVSGAGPSLDSVLVRIAQERLVIAETDSGIVPFIKRLAKQGLSHRDVARSVSYNIVSHSHLRLNATNRVTYKLTASDLTTLEQFITIDELRSLLEEHGLLSGTINKFSDVAWVMKAENSVSFLSMIGLRTPQNQIAMEDYLYTRALVDINHELEQAVKHNKTMVELEQSIKYAQKKSLLRSAIISAVRKEIDTTELIAMLRA